MADIENKRKSIPKSVRFEVLKRDKFICQYCGEAAPDVVLHIDHLNPVANDGDNDITNLITSCEGCNQGKSDKLLSDDSAVKKAKSQLDKLQERREQLEMMMEWQRGLKNLADTTVSELCSYWEVLALGYQLNDNGKNDIKKWVRTFSIPEIASAMDIAAEQYLKFESDDKVTLESWTLAFGKISGICRVNRQAKTEPDIRELYYIRGILRNRLRYCDDGLALEQLKDARFWGVSLDALRSIALQTKSWTSFKGDVDFAIRETETWQMSGASGTE